LANNLTSLAFSKSEDLQGVNIRICEYIRIVIGTMLKKLPVQTQLFILDSTRNDVLNKENAEISYIF
jgi:hypothetical protein